MKISAFRSKLDNLILILLVVYTVYGIVAVFFNIFPIYLHAFILKATGAVALVSTVGFISLINWNGRLPKSILLLIILIACLSASVLLQFLFLQDLNDNLGRSALEYTRAILILGVIWILFGGAVQRLIKPESIFLSIGILVFLSFSVLKNLDGGLIISYGALTDARSDGVELNHLVVGESATFLLLLAFAFMPLAWRVVPFIFSIAILFSLGGRSALFSYLLTVAIYALLKTSMRRLWLYVFGIILIAVIPSIGVVPIDFNNDAVARMLFLQGILSDGSVQERQVQFTAGLNALSEQILMGDPTFLIRTFGSMGTYMHNILSAWQFFGFFVFICIVFLLVRIGYFIFIKRNSFCGPVDDFGILIFIYSVISILGAKHIGFQMFWFALGFWLFRMGFKSKKIF